MFIPQPACPTHVCAIGEVGGLVLQHRKCDEPFLSALLRKKKTKIEEMCVVPEEAHRMFGFYMVFHYLGKT